MSKFVVILPQSTAEQQTVVHNLFTTRAHWWHWTGEVWLLNFVNENLTAEQVKKEIHGPLPGVYCLVFKVDKTEFSGWGPQEWVQWFNQYWK